MEPKIMYSPCEECPSRFPVDMFSFEGPALKRLMEQRNEDYAASMALEILGDPPFGIIYNQENLIVHDDGSATVVALLGIQIEESEDEVKVGWIGDLIIGRLGADEYQLIQQGSWGGVPAQDIEA